MYNKDMKLLIKYAIELDISDLKTFKGYKGGDMLSFISSSSETIKKIKEFCHKMSIDTNIKRSKTTNDFEIFCQFGIDRYGVDDTTDFVYGLKD